MRGGYLQRVIFSHKAKTVGKALCWMMGGTLCEPDAVERLAADAARRAVLFVETSKA
jgi:hypothetical protein